MFKNFRGPLQATLLLLIILLIAHISMASQLNLSVDGAHYALYAKYLDWSYFDHPPMVGWLQALVIHYSTTDLALRIVPITLSFIWPLLLYVAVRTLFPHRSAWLAFLAVALSQSMTLLFLFTLAYTPQLPLITFCLLATITFWRALEKGRLFDWLLLGLALGLAGLSDYSALCFAFGIALFILCTRRKILLTIGPWLSMLLAIALAIPVIYWNWQHDWISISFQLHHGTAGEHWSFTPFLQSQVIQFLAYTPWMYLLGYFTLCRSFLRLWREPAIRFISLIAASYLLLFLWSAGQTRVLPHWPALGWIFISILIAYHFREIWKPSLSTILQSCIFTYAIIVTLVLVSLSFRFWLPIPMSQNPIHDFYGWPQAAKLAKEQLSSLAQQGKMPPGLFVSNWTLASRLAWYTQLPVQVADNHTQTNQFDLWFGRPKAQAYGIVVVPVGWQVPQGPGPGYFEYCQLRTELAIKQDRQILNRFAFYYCDGFHALS